MASRTTGDYVVIAFDAAGGLRGLRSRVRGSRLKLVGCAESAPEAGDLLFRLETLGRELGVSRGTYLYFTGELPGGSYFECRTADLPRRELTDSLIFEAQQHLPKTPEHCRVEFVTGEAADGLVEVKAYAFPAAALDPWIEVITALRWRPDGFVHPLLALPELPPGSAVLIPELGMDFFRRDGAWLPAHPAPAECNRELKEYLAACFPDGYGGDPYRGGALVTTRVAAWDFATWRPVMEVFPETLAPRRIRSQLRITAVLLLLWLGIGIWGAGRTVYRYAAERSLLLAEIDDLVARTAELERKIKSAEKNQKEYRRILELANGDRDFLAHLALLSGVLPDDVLLSGLRAAEGNWELTLMSETEGLDPGAELRRLPGFKLTGLQQRAMGSTLQTYTAKLAMTEAAAREGKKP